MKSDFTTRLLDSLDGLRFDNRFVRELPGDPEPSNRVRQVEGACYSRVAPAKVSRPQLVAFSREMAELLDLSPVACEGEAFAEVFTGNRLLTGMEPYAMCYGGHQFGHWAGQLGDGRAINLGEVLNSRGGHWTLQLKGSGLTPYSRRGDGLAVLRSSIREFLCSEAMQHLGIPTTRALSLVLTGEQVTRDMFYDGHPKLEPGAIVCRVSPSFLRFGSFQIFTWRNDLDNLRKLVDFCLKYDYPHLPAPSVTTYLQWFAEICQRTADLMVNWMRVGFVHGVMNTDNLSILGLTIDYGPYGWLEDYDPEWTPNTTDAEGRRYCFGRQPQIALWNLAQLANAIYPLIGRAEPLEESLKLYGQRYQQRWREMMAAKLGLRQFEAADEGLLQELDAVLRLAETDMTIFYRRLADVEAAPDAPEEQLLGPLAEAYYRSEQLTDELRAQIAGWLRRYRRRVLADGLPVEERRAAMKAVNPKYVLRNYLAQEAIDLATTGDFRRIHELLELLRRPYEEQAGMERFAQKRPDWARHKAGCSMLSCSS